MKKLDTPNPAFQRLSTALSPPARTDPFTGGACLKVVDHHFGGKQATDTAGASLTQTALFPQQAASESGAATAVAAQPTVASSSIVFGSVCAVPQLQGQGSESVESLSSLFPGMLQFLFVPHQAPTCPLVVLDAHQIELSLEHAERGMLFPALHSLPLRFPNDPLPSPPPPPPFRLRIHPIPCPPLTHLVPWTLTPAAF